METIKFRAWDGERKKFQYFDINQSWTPMIENAHNYLVIQGAIFEQFTGLHDKNGKEIYLSDVIRFWRAYRTTQTHTGNNIPNGSYTEPMEPGIRTFQGVVDFIDCSLVVKTDHGDRLLSDACYNYGLSDIESDISYRGAGIFDDPEDGDLQYLISEVAKVNTADELLAYLSGCEVIGNIHENPDLL